MTRVILSVLLAMFLSPSYVVAQVRAAADVSCRPAGPPLQYDCTIKLTDSRAKAPLSGATVVVGADMPSMPMAHNVRPRNATPASEPGLYHVRLELVMEGSWALRIDVAGPLRDRIVVPLTLEGSAGRAAPRSRPTRHPDH